MRIEVKDQPTSGKTACSETRQCHEYRVLCCIRLPIHPAANDHDLIGAHFKLVLYQTPQANRTLMGNIIACNKHTLKKDQLAELENITTFKRKELKTRYKAFVAQNPSGLLDLKGFRQLYRGLSKIKDSGPVIDLIFRTFDSNNDGTIDFKELMCACSVSSQSPLDDRLKWIFKVYDTNGDKVITRSEMLSVFSVVAKVTGEEQSAKQRVDNIFRDMDVDNNNKLTLEEFISGCRQDESLIRAFDSMKM